MQQNLLNAQIFNFNFLIHFIIVCSAMSIGTSIYIISSARMGPVTGLSDSKNFIRRIKPLYFLTEKEIMTYAYLNKLSTDFNECPYSHLNYRSKLRDIIKNSKVNYFTKDLVSTHKLNFVLS